MSLYLVPFEIAAIVAVAIAPVPETVPVAIPLVAIAALSVWIRKRPLLAEANAPDRWRLVIGAGAGLVALAVALLAATPLVEAIVGQAVQWSTYPIARGSFGQALAVIVVVSATAIAMEIAMRAWILERALELTRSRAAAIAIAAIAEGAITRGSVAVRIGAAVFGAGLGWIYLAGGKTLGAPLAARLVFVVGAVVLEAAMMIG